MKESEKLELKAKMAKTIEAFKESFYKEYNLTINTYFVEKNPILKPLSLMDIELIAEEHCKDKNVMRVRSRVRTYVDIRHVLFKKCLDMGYGPSEIAAYFEWDHASILHASKKIKQLLQANDPILTNLFNTLTDAINKRIELKGTTQSNIVSKDNTQSTISAMLYPGIHQSLDDKFTPGVKKFTNGSLAH